MIEEDERANHPRLRRRQRAADGKSIAEVGGPGHHQRFDRVTLEFVPGGWVFSGKETHRMPPAPTRQRHHMA
jgi:hypothetical protein